MVGSWFFDGDFNGVSEDFNLNGFPEAFFDDVINTLDDFPLEDVEGIVGEEDWNSKLQYLDPPSMDALVGVPSKPDKNHPIAFGRTQIKQEPTSADTTASRINPLGDNYADDKHRHQFKTSSPVSILESSSISCFVENPRVAEPRFPPVKRARSKRSRRRQIKFFPLLSPHSSASDNLYPLAASESDTDTHHTGEIFKSVKRKQKRKKNILRVTDEERRKLLSMQQPGEAKKCLHCEVTSTPQWREGPMGPKTLCNACGVRYRSGRLFPEYRPAASPTFIPSLHSNSHKKVIEMRSKVSYRHGTLASIQPAKRLDSLIV